MSRNRRGGHSGLEFGGSGEDSFVAVVVTKLTGALLFILLLTMIIMALLPKAVDLPSDQSPRPTDELTVATPETLPEAIAGRPYRLALAATGGKGALRWSISGNLPDGLALASETGRIEGTPLKGTPEPAEVTLSVTDGTSRAMQATRLVVYQSDRPLTTPAWWKPGIPPVPWRAWLEQGFGFFVLWLVHVVGMNTISSLERWSIASADSDPGQEPERRDVPRRFTIYRTVVRLASLSAAVALAVWLWRHHS
jgi:preprotein translocase subunit SecG